MNKRKKPQAETPRQGDIAAESRAALQLLMDNIPDTIYFKDTESRFTLVNKAQAATLGAKDPSDFIGKTDFDFLAPETAAETFEDERRILTTGKPLVGKIEKLLWPDGQIRWVSATKVPLRGADGTIIGIVGISRDMTEVKSMETRLEHERNLMRTLIDNIPDYIYFKDRQSKFVISNRAHLAHIGRKKNPDVAGKTDFDIFPREFAESFFKDEQTIMATKKPLIEKEELTINPDGNKRWLLTTKVALLDADNRVSGLVGISRDITERKAIEEAMKRAKDDLEAAVTVRTADLKEAYQRLEERLEQLNFLTRTSYELAQYTSVDQLFPAILDAFVTRFHVAEAGLCRRGERGFECTNATPGLDSVKGRQCCERALAALGTREIQTPLLVENWTKDKFLHRLPWPDLKELPCYLAIPLLADNKMVSCVQIFTASEGSALYEHEKPLITTLSAHAAVCQTNAEHYAKLSEQARLEGELEAARTIQRSYMPQEKPPIPHVNLKGVYYPAFEVGGDYLDYFKTDKGAWVVVIADVCGKGVPAALHMTVLRHTFRMEARTHTSAMDLLCAVNEAMRMHLDNKSFVTALCLIINENGTAMSYGRAGHPMLLKLGEPGDAPVGIPCNGVALGLVSDPHTFASLGEEVSISLEKGDRYLLYTDGLTEANNPSRETYGIARLSALLSQERSRNPDKIIMSIMTDVKKFAQDAPYHDDLTMLAIEIT